MIEELASVVLTTDIPERGLQTGDIGTVVMYIKPAWDIPSNL